MMKAALILLLIIPTAFAFDWDTHRYAANEICDAMSCGQCLNFLEDGAVAPDRDFHDFVNHVCYNTSKPCTDSEYWDCPAQDRCPALIKMQEWMSKNDTGCQHFYNIGVASHYFLDSKCFWHTVVNESSDQCHQPFETQIGEKIEADFAVTVCSVSLAKAEFESYVDEFLLMFNITRQKTSAPPGYWDANKWGAVILIGFLVILILARFFYFRAYERI